MDEANDILTSRFAVERVRTTHSATAGLAAGTGAQVQGRPGRGSEIAMVSAGSLAGGRREPSTAAMGNEGRLPAGGRMRGVGRAGDRRLNCRAMGVDNDQASIRR